MNSPFARFAQQSVNPMMARLQGMYQAIFNSGNPMAAMQNMFGNQPQFAQAMNLFRQGRNPESVFREMARQRGVDPDAFLRQLQGNNGQ